MVTAVRERLPASFIEVIEAFQQAFPSAMPPRATDAV
jgi:hypothetical protein